MLPPISPKKETVILINIDIIWQVVQMEMEMSGGWDNIRLSLIARMNMKSG